MYIYQVAFIKFKNNFAHKTVQEFMA